MEDLAGFASAHPAFCNPKEVRVPGHGVTLGGLKIKDLVNEGRR